MINYNNLTEEQKHFVMNTEVFGMDEDDYIMMDGKYVVLRDIEIEMED